MGFDPVQALIGGYLLHLSSSTLLADTGRVMGISGIVDGAFLGDGAMWRTSTLLGLVSGPIVTRWLSLGTGWPDAGASSWSTLGEAGLWRLGLSGLLVGVGTKVSSEDCQLCIPDILYS